MLATQITATVVAPTPPPPPPSTSLSPDSEQSLLIAATAAACINPASKTMGTIGQVTSANDNQKKNIETCISIKNERRDSTTSESSLEQLDLGRKLERLNTATSTPVNDDKKRKANDILNAKYNPEKKTSYRLDNSDEAKEYNNEDHTTDEKNHNNDKLTNIPIKQEQQQQKVRQGSRNNHHRHKRHYNHLNLLDPKHTNVQLEFNADNPHSLRKKFRFSRTFSDNTATCNESGFVDISSSNNSSQLINHTNSTMNSKSNSSSAASTPPHTGHPLNHGLHNGQGDNGGSSPESGIGERDDMKYVCPICDVVSATPHEFTNHIRCHNYASGDTENFTCRICSKILSSASSLDRHVLVHTGERPFNCKYCHLTFTTNGNMHRHMRTHKQHQHGQHYHRRHSSGGKISNNNSNNNSNSNIHTSPITNDNITKNSNSNKNNFDNNDNNTAIALISEEVKLLEHNKIDCVNNDTINIKNDRSDKSNCVLLSVINEMNSLKHFNGHSKSEKNYESDGNSTTDSSITNSQTSPKINNNDKNNNLHHINKTDKYQFSNNLTIANNFHNEKEILLKRSNISANSNNDRIKETTQIPRNSNDVNFETCMSFDKGVHITLTCPMCDKNEFNDILDLDQHMDSKHSNIPAKCKYCKVIFQTHHQLNTHPCIETRNYFDFHHILNSTDAINIAKKGTNENNSTFIDGSDDTYTNCQDNIIHLKQKDLICQMLLKNTLLSQNQQSLTETCDEDIKSEPSAQDSKDLADIQTILNMTSSSNTSNFLKNFEQSVNTPSSQCSYDRDEEEAQDAFTCEFRKMKLRGEFPCKLCSAIYPNLRALKGHNRIHLNEVGPNGPFRCNMCPYTTCDKTVLIRHMRTHNGDRPYECAVCNYAFTTKANCERHLRNRHAKTTREQVKRAIIYHPSEDSTCDDTTKKMHIFSSPEFDDDGDTSTYQQHIANDCSTPVSHLKEMLSTHDSPSKSIKIQVKSLEQLLDKPLNMQNYYKDHNSDFEKLDHRIDLETNSENIAPIDMSMDVLDLSNKKPPVTSNLYVEEKNIRPTDMTLTNHMNSEIVVDRNLFENNYTTVPINEPIQLATERREEHQLPHQEHQQQEQHEQLFMTQQQLLPDPAHYFQQLYRNLIFPQLHPFFFSNTFLQNGNLTDIQKFSPFLNQLFGINTAFSSSDTAERISSMNIINENPITHSSTNVNCVTESNSNLSNILPQMSPLLSDKSSSTSVNSLPSPKDMLSPNPASLSTISRHGTIQPTSNHLASTIISNGPVKMVLKNGVFMPKQKQRRYRTERPFACDHCSARFTLRSNMERHVKQQHPQYYAQRQRNGHIGTRGRGANNTNLNNITHLQTAFAQAYNSTPTGMNSISPISDQVKFAILAQQLKSHKDSTDLLQHALAHNSNNITNNLDSENGNSLKPNSNLSHITNNIIPNSLMEDDEPKLIIDEEDDKNEKDEEMNSNENCENISIDNNVSNSDSKLHSSPEVAFSKTKKNLSITNKISESILGQAIVSKLNKNINSVEISIPKVLDVIPASSMNTMIAQAPAVGKFLKEVASSSFKDESQDLVPVAKLVDNATSNSVTFNNYFRPSDLTNHTEQSDEEGLVASGSASESNNSGAEDATITIQPKKKSAYSLAPNRVSCPYCQRMFPWSSSLRRHILTHTGQKPFKCSHCPLLFTTKSNCDRHLLRKHGNIESATSVYVPTEDVNEPIPPPKSVEEIEKMLRQQREEEMLQRKMKTQDREQIEKNHKRQTEREKPKQREADRKQHEKEEQRQQECDQQQILKQLTASQLQQFSPKPEGNSISSSDLPFKCHLCENSFGERMQCLEHIKCLHVQEFALLLAKGAIESDVDSAANEEDDRVRNTNEENCIKTPNGKYPDYSNRKVICAFCLRRFWSTEDLRRHMRTHSGERPFQCEICMRKFTLKHSMLRHMKKHNGLNPSNCQISCEIFTNGNSGSDYSDDEQCSNAIVPMESGINVNPFNMNALDTKLQELLTKANEWRNNGLNVLKASQQKESLDCSGNNESQSDLIGNLLGISDQNVLSKLMSSPDEAAKLLGLDK